MCFRFPPRLFAAALAGCAVVATARALNPDTPAGSYAIQGWFAEDGLPSSRIRSVYQSSDGYIWLATTLGISRFDGLRFANLTTATEPNLGSNNFYHIEGGADGALWFASAVGLYRYQAGAITRYGTADGLPSNYIRIVYRLRDGRMLVGTDRGVSVFSGGRATTPPPWRTPTGAIRAFIECQSGSVWVGGRDGLWRITGDRCEMLSGTKDWPHATYTAFAEAADGSLWVGCNQDLRCWHPDGRVEAFAAGRGGTSASIETLHLDHDGILWVGTAGGLFRMHGGRIEHAEYPAQIGASLMGEMGETREGALWVTSNAGVFQLRDTPAHAVSYAEGLDQAGAVTMLDTQDGAWWIGLWNGGVYRYDRGRASPVAEFASIRASVYYAMAEDSDGTLWIGGDSGLHRKRNGAWENLYLGAAAAAWQKRLAAEPGLELPGLAHNRVNSIAPDGAGGHWIATLGALYHATAEDRFRVVAGTLGCNVRAVYRTRDGDIWASVQPKGVMQRHAGQWRIHTAADGLANAAPRAIYEDAVGSIWVCSSAGVSRFTGGKWRVYGERAGLFGQINSVIEDGLGYLWFGTPKGVMRVARSDFDALDAGRKARVAEQTMTRRDGMPDSECIEVGSPNVWATRTGEILFPTNSGLAVFNPRAVRLNAVPPPVQIESVLLGGVAQPMNRALEFPPGGRDIEIHFSGTSFLEPERVRFKVRLAPLDPHWIDLGNRHDIRYPRLPPGDYDFHVIACNNDDVWNETGARLHFRVRPFFYQTTWFRALGLMSLGGLAIGAYRWRVRRLRSHAEQLRVQNQELERRVAVRTSELAESYRTLKRAQQDLMDASRLAGMAEVATGVLHNVGNVLSSVNTSATMVAAGVDRLRAPNLGKVAQLLADNEGRLAEFVATDPRGRKLPDYLARLAEHLEAERDATLREVQALQANVEHIKEIVVAQQSFARAPGVVERIAAGQLIEVAVGVVEPLFTEHAIGLTRDFADGSVVAVERAKVVQVLVNLLRNATEAVVEANGPARNVTVRLRPTNDGAVEIGVTDTGVGIPAENLTRIFSFGFTTKPGGHGFGLHSSALVAKQLGGSLVAGSEGPGRGATFVLRIPAAPAPGPNGSPRSV